MTRSFQNGSSVYSLNDVALDKLDFESIRGNLSRHITFPAAKCLSMKLKPSFNRDEVYHLQKETAEGRALLDEVGDLNLNVTGDATSSVNRAASQGLLTCKELLVIANHLDTLSHARNAVRKSISSQTNKLPLLNIIASKIPECAELKSQILRQINDSSEIADDATKALHDIRRQKRFSYDHLTNELSKIIQSAKDGEFQDRIISMREGRLVVQVKATMRHRLPGIVHDVSNTGATLFVEPFSTVDLCNNWRNLIRNEDREVTQILRNLSSLVGKSGKDIQCGMENTALLDFILARARLAIENGDCDSMAHEKDEKLNNLIVHILNGRHPLLNDDPVPLDMSLGPDCPVLVITGPNTGGKTVAMKTLGLLSMMHQSGLQVPVGNGSRLPTFDGIYIDIGDSQNIEESTSTFGSHISQIIQILKHATPDSLVLLDEIGGTTDPEEGSALAKSILKHLASRKVFTVATTHQHTIAAFAEITDGMRNASVHLDPSTSQPTYQLTMGVPSKSYALEVASSLGLPEEILNHANSLLSSQGRDFEALLTNLYSAQEQIQSELLETKRAKKQVQVLRQRLESQIEYLTSQRDSILSSFQRKLAEEFSNAKGQLKRVEAALSWSDGGHRRSGVNTTKVREKRKKIAQIQKEVQSLRSHRSIPHVISAGDIVEIKGLRLKGTVESVNEKGKEAEVNVGNARLSVGHSELVLLEEAIASSKIEIHVKAESQLSSIQLDLRGLRVEKALEELEKFIDSAALNGQATAVIIHGHGTGTLRQVIREHLHGHPLALSFQPGNAEQGGDGVTQVKFT